MATLRALHERYRDRPVTAAVLLDPIRSRYLLLDLCNTLDPIEAAMRRRKRELEYEWERLKKPQAWMLAEKQRVGLIVPKVSCDGYNRPERRELSFDNGK